MMIPQITRHRRVTACDKCHNPNLPPRYGIGNGISVQPCPLCGTQHYIFPAIMQRKESPAEPCSCCLENFVDSENVNLCAICRHERRGVFAQQRRSANALARETQKHEITSGAPHTGVQGQGSGVNLKLGTRNLKLYCACGAIIPPSKNPNPKVPKEHCSRKCKDAANTEARKTGKRVMTAVPMRSEREVLISTMEKLKASGQAIVVKSARKTTMPTQVLNLGAMTHQERLGALCRAAERQGVMWERRPI